MKKEYQQNIDQFKRTIEANKPLKIAVYVGAGLLAFFVLGKIASVMASSMKGMKEFQSAFNGLTKK